MAKRRSKPRARQGTRRKRAKRRKRASKTVNPVPYLWAAVAVLLVFGLYTTAPTGYITATSAPTMFAPWTEYQGAGQAGYTRDTGPDEAVLAWRNYNVRVKGTPIYDGEKIWVNTKDKMISLNNRGEVIDEFYWTHLLKFSPTKTKIYQYVETVTYPYYKYVPHDVLIFMSTAGSVWIMDTEAGEALRSIASKDISPPVTDGNSIFLVAPNGRLAKYRSKGLTQVWEYQRYEQVDKKFAVAIELWDHELGRLESKAYQTTGKFHDVKVGGGPTLKGGYIYFVSETTSPEKGTLSRLYKLSATQDVKLQKGDWYKYGCFNFGPWYAPDPDCGWFKNWQIEDNRWTQPKFIWRTDELTGAVQGAPVVVDNRIYVATALRLFAFNDMGDKKEKAWDTYFEAGKQPTVYRISSREHVIYAIDQNGQINLFNHVGKLIWSSENTYKSIEGPVVAAGTWPNVIVYVKAAGKVHALDGGPDGGKELWSSEYIGTDGGLPIVSDNYLFVGDYSGFYAYVKDDKAPRITAAKPFPTEAEVSLDTKRGKKISFIVDVEDDIPSSGLKEVYLEVEEDGVWTKRGTKTYELGVFSAEGVEFKYDIHDESDVGKSRNWRMVVVDNAGNEKKVEGSFVVKWDQEIDMTPPEERMYQVCKKLTSGRTTCPITEVKPGESAIIQTRWKDDKALKEVVLYWMEEIPGPTEITAKELDGLKMESREFAISSDKEGANIVWWFKVCDKASQYGVANDRCTETEKRIIKVSDITAPAFSSVKAESETLHEIILYSGEETTFDDHIIKLETVGVNSVSVIVDGEGPSVIGYGSEKTISGIKIKVAEILYVSDSPEESHATLEIGVSIANVDPGKTITLTADVSDNVALASVSFYMRNELEPIKVVTLTGTGGTATYTATPDKGLQNQEIEWRVVVRDLTGNYRHSEWKKFLVNDITEPEVKAYSSAPDRVGVGETAEITAALFDEHSKVDSYSVIVNGEVACTGSPNRNESMITCRTKATNAQFAAGEGRYKIKVVDDYGNEFTTAEKGFTVTANCTAVDTQNPFAFRTRQSGTEVLPGDMMDFTSVVSDSVDIYGCGGLKSAKLMMVGADEFERTIQTTDLTDPDAEHITKKESFVEAGVTKYKSAEANLTFTWLVPEEREPKWSDIELTGLGVSLVNPGLFGRGLGPSSITGLVTVGAGATPAKKPFGLPGTDITWKIVVFDDVGNDFETFTQKFKIMDVKPPAFDPEGTSQSSDKMLPGQELEFSACMADAGQLKEAVLEVNFAGTWIGVQSLDLLPDNAWAGKKLCKDFTYRNPALTTGTNVMWRVKAIDAEGNEALSGIRSFRVVSNPPSWSNKRMTPEAPLQGEEVTISVDWTDDTGLKEAVFMTDETGVWTEAGRVSLIGRSDTAVFKWKNPLLEPGTVVNWKVIGYDIDDNSDETDPAFTIAPDVTAPEWSELEQSTDTPAQGEVVFLSAKFTDNAGLDRAVLETDEGGEFKVIMSTELTSIEDTARFSWQNPAIAAGTVVSWRIKGVDAADNSVTTDTMMFTVQEAPAVCPRCPEDVDWSACIRGKQTRTTYTCGADTAYKCKAVFDEKTCTNTLQELALYAVEDARTAIATAEEAGKDITEAEEMLAEAEGLYAEAKYLDAKLKAEEALTAAEAAPTLIKPVELLWIVLAVVVAIAAVSLLVMRKRMGKAGEAPAAQVGKKKISKNMLIAIIVAIIVIIVLYLVLACSYDLPTIPGLCDVIPPITVT
ncbi:MAG: PQQ-binding-like beta-propeller repeat protein [Candidatus Aenigmatarchaeota archaeon]